MLSGGTKSLAFITLCWTFLVQHASAQDCPNYLQAARADIGKDRTYLKDESALRAFEGGHEGRKIEVSRFKGLGEMDWQELGETTMDAGTRTLLQITVEEAAIADEVFSTLMGDDVPARRTFIQENAKDVRFLDV